MNLASQPNQPANGDHPLKILSFIFARILRVNQSTMRLFPLIPLVNQINQEKATTLEKFKLSIRANPVSQPVNHQKRTPLVHSRTLLPRIWLVNQINQQKATTL